MHPHVPAVSAPGPSLLHGGATRAPAPVASPRQLRLLIVIASFGNKNLAHLKTIIRTYLQMSMKVEIVVVSDAHKDLGEGIRVVVGLPDKNPWSLPFAHQAILAEQVGQHDLFAYSEDDMAVTEGHIQSFLRVTPYLRPHEVAGFLRYEVAPSGSWSLPDFHGPFHWEMGSVRKRGTALFAQFTNEHAGFYLLTRDQLRHAVASGRFTRGPHEERYGLPETAATDAYTQCGLQKVFCISSPREFFIHHMPNRYIGHCGIPYATFEQEVQTLLHIYRAGHPATSLCPVETKLPYRRWNKCYDEKAPPEVVSMIPAHCGTILSFGSGRGSLETLLRDRGAKVTVVPLDSVIGAQLERAGFETVYGDMKGCFVPLRGRSFDCVVLTNLLHLVADPSALIHQLAQRVTRGGSMVLSGPNFNTLPVWIKRALAMRYYHRLGAYHQSGVHSISPAILSRMLKANEMRISELRWQRPAKGMARPKGWKALLPTPAVSWVLKAV